MSLEVESYGNLLLKEVQAIIHGQS